MQFLSALDLPEVVTLPAAASHPGSLFSNGGKAWYSTGTIWIDLTDARLNTLTSVSSVANVTTLDLSLGSFFETDLTEDTVLVFINGPASPEGAAFSLRVKQHASSAKTITSVPAGVLWLGEDYATNTVLGSTDEIGFTYYTSSLITGKYGGDQRVSPFELLSNKATDLTSPDNTKYPSTLAVSTALALKLNSATYTAADVLAKLLTVDGAGSGVDADLLDAQSSTYYLARANHTGTQLAATVSDFDAAAQAAAVATTITNGVTTSAPNQNVVYDTLAAMLGVFSPVVTEASTAAANAVIGLYWLQPATMTLTGVGAAAVPLLIDIKAADYPTILGLTAKLRINAIVSTNDFAPGTTFTFGLYPVTRPAVSGASGVLIYDLGTVVTGSDGAQAVTPAADTSASFYSSEFALPSDGLYTIGVLTSVASTAASSRTHFSLALQVRYA